MCLCFSFPFNYDNDAQEGASFQMMITELGSSDEGVFKYDGAIQTSDDGGAIFKMKLFKNKNVGCNGKTMVMKKK